MPTTHEFLNKFQELLKTYIERFDEGRFEAAAQAAEMMQTEARLLRNVAKIHAETPQEPKACLIDDPECEACQ